MLQSLLEGLQSRPACPAQAHAGLASPQDKATQDASMTDLIHDRTRGMPCMHACVSLTAPPTALGRTCSGGGMPTAMAAPAGSPAAKGALPLPAPQAG